MPSASKSDLARSAELFHALSDETRLGILEMLGAGERCVCELQDAFNAAQSRLSYHLKILKSAGMVSDRQEGRWSYYRIEPEAVAELRLAIGEFAEHSSWAASTSPTNSRRTLPIAGNS